MFLNVPNSCSVCCDFYIHVVLCHPQPNAASCICDNAYVTADCIRDSRLHVWGMCWVCVINIVTQYSPTQDRLPNLEVAIPTHANCCQKSWRRQNVEVWFSCHEFAEAPYTGAHICSYIPPVHPLLYIQYKRHLGLGLHQASTCNSTLSLLADVHV